eukprot:scaffold4926_cov101-Isochrysis_galbana.AAC.1
MPPFCNGELALRRVSESSGRQPQCDRKGTHGICPPLPSPTPKARVHLSQPRSPHPQYLALLSLHPPI